MGAIDIYIPRDPQPDRPYEAAFLAASAEKGEAEVG